MITIRIAGITVCLKNRYDYTEMLCRDYVVQDCEADFEVEATDEEISEEMSTTEEKTSEAYAEAVCLHRKIADRLWQYDACLLHAALIDCDGQGYAFAARSGVGKSTHIRLWRKNFGESVRVVNGDKPIVRVTEEGVFAFGTPWNGKEGYGENRGCPFRGVCFLERGDTNAIEDISPEDAAMRLFPQVYLPSDGEAVDKTLSLLDQFVDRLSFWRLRCNMEDEAARVAHDKMTRA